jgi:tetratricopeptide (TPR) repeat protein
MRANSKMAGRIGACLLLLAAGAWGGGERSASRLTRRLALRSALATLGAVALSAERAGAEVAEGDAFGKVCYRAGRLFEDGKYAEAEEAWAKIVATYPQRALGWQNLATVELILTAGALTLDELPATGASAARIEAAIGHFRRAAELDGDVVDGLALNNEASVLFACGHP